MMITMEEIHAVLTPSPTLNRFTNVSICASIICTLFRAFAASLLRYRTVHDCSLMHNVVRLRVVDTLCLKRDCSAACWSSPVRLYRTRLERPHVTKSLTLVLVHPWFSCGMCPCAPQSNLAYLSCIRRSSCLRQLLCFGIDKYDVILLSGAQRAGC